MSGKKYGLILPGANKGQQPTFQASRNVFGDDSDSDDGPKKQILLRPSQNITRQAKITQEKALVEDPTVYQYDELYDSMSSQKKEKKKKSTEDKKPKYIDNLLKTANKRKIENERRLERQIQKEREREGDEFADKEVFVTTAYKKKLEEMRLEEEKEKREEYLESIGDVTKQKDLGGFYRHIYEQKLVSGNDVDVKKDNKEDEDGIKTPQKLDSFKEVPNKNKKDKHESSRKRNYRKRKASDAHKDLSDGEIEESDDEINHVNLTDIKKAKHSKGEENIDADSDFSIDESSEEENIPENKMQREDDCKTPDEEMKKPQLAQKSKEKVNTKVEKIVKENVVPKQTKPKIDIWKKRTVGEVFDQALQRYYERKASRGL